MNASYLTPAITFFHEDGTLDLENQAKLFENLVENGMDGILVEGSASEFFAMSMDQRRELAGFAVRQVNHRVKLIVNTSNMVADEIVRFSGECLDAGADAVMILPPYYAHFGADALLRYYDRLARKIHGPIYIYNFPGNVGYSIPPETLARLMELHENIVGLKDTTPDMVHTREVIKAAAARRPDFEVYSGFDDNFAHNLLSGGSGCIGTLSNLAPEFCSAWTRAFRENDLEGIAAGQRRANALMDLYSVCDQFPTAFKEALRLRGFAVSSASTFPAADITKEESEKVLEILRKGGIQ